MFASALMRLFQVFLSFQMYSILSSKVFIDELLFFVGINRLNIRFLGI